MLAKLIRYSLLTAICIAMLSPAYSATIQQYSDVATFTALTENMTLVTFDNLGVNQGGLQNYYDSNGVVTSGASFVGVTNYGGYFTALGWGVNNSFDWDTNATVRGPGGSDQHLRIVLPAGIFAIGMNLMTSDSDVTAGGMITVKTSNADIITPISTTVWNTGMGNSPKTAGVSAAWWGFISDSPIAYLDISSDTGYVVLDNVQFGEKATEIPPPTGDVPEAATMILIGTGLAGFSLLRRFHFNQAV